MFACCIWWVIDTYIWAFCECSVRLKMVHLKCSFVVLMNLNCSFVLFTEHSGYRQIQRRDGRIGTVMMLWVVFNYWNKPLYIRTTVIRWYGAWECLIRRTRSSLPVPLWTGGVAAGSCRLVSVTSCNLTSICCVAVWQLAAPGSGGCCRTICLLLGILSLEACTGEAGPRGIPRGVCARIGRLIECVVCTG